MLPTADELHSIEAFNKCLFDWHERKGRSMGYELVSLGQVTGHDIWLLSAERIGSSRPLLLAGGFHGDEPCGSWGILDFLCERVSRLGLCGLPSFLPLVNPTGFIAATRCNDMGQNPNAGFLPIEGRPVGRSREGDILVAHVGRLFSLARDGFTSLHEDPEQLDTYVYTFERSERPGNFSSALVDALENHFTLRPDGPSPDGFLTNGVVFNDSDGSFEDYLFQKGVFHTACSETPGLQPLARRIAANCDLVEAFLRHHYP